MPKTSKGAPLESRAFQLGVRFLFRRRRRIVLANAEWRHSTARLSMSSHGNSYRSRSSHGTQIIHGFRFGGAAYLTITARFRNPRWPYCANLDVIFLDAPAVQAAPDAFHG